MYVKHYLRPQFKQLGKGGAFFKPQYLKLFGSHISVDDFPTIIGARDANVQLTSWNIGGWEGELKIGKYCLITPGVIRQYFPIFTSPFQSPIFQLVS